MKKYRSPIKKMLFAYLAASKVLSWIETIPANFEGVGNVILNRLLQQDLILISFIVIMYFVEYKCIDWDKRLANIKLFISGYVIFVVLLISNLYAQNLFFSLSINVREILLSQVMLNMSIIFFVVMVAVTVKEHIKKKDAVEYALKAQGENIKLEVLKTFLDDGVLSHEEFEKLKGKLSKV